MNIAVIAYDSILYRISNSGQCLCIKKDFTDNGPKLPIEYARVSGNYKKPQRRKLTLVIRRGAEPQSTSWAEMDFNNLDDAMNNLAQRETGLADPTGDGVGFLNIRTGNMNLKESKKKDRGIKLILESWTKDHPDIDAIIWSNWLSNFAKRIGERCTPETAVKFLEGLSKRELAGARDYILKTGLDTRFSRTIREKFNW